MTANFTCNKGLLIPTYIEAQWSQSSRAVLYFVALLYSFAGIAILADVFMCAILRITSTTRKVRVSNGVTRTDGDRARYETVLIWNPTVANLTLMALGSSAPEILLSLIELIGNDFKAGNLGPGTIVGSAAFNLMVISAVCITVIPTGRTKRISNISVFYVTTLWSCFAYIWLIVILVFISKDEVEIWEGCLTLIFFFILVLMAYGADVKLWKSFKSLKNGISSSRRSETGDIENRKNLTVKGDTVENRECLLTNRDSVVSEDQPWKTSDFDQMKRDYVAQFRDLPPKDLAELVAKKIYVDCSHNYLEHRVEAIRSLFRCENRPKDSPAPEAKKKEILTIEFAAKTYAFHHGDQEQIRLKILRRGRLRKTALFRCCTLSGTAKKNEHFLPKMETLFFNKNETEKFVTVDLVGGPVSKWSAHDSFQVRLELDSSHAEDPRTQVGKCCSVKVTFEPAGVENKESVINFKKSNFFVKESMGTVRLYVKRSGNSNSKALVKYVCEDISAQEGLDYLGSKGQISFDQYEIEKFFDLDIIDDAQVEKDETFLVRLEEPTSNASLGNMAKAIVTIVNDDRTSVLMAKIDRLIPTILNSLKPGALSWKDQFVRALNVNGGDIYEATMADYFCHLFSLPWKTLAALVPPPGLLGGWLTFSAALFLIGLVTALVGDLASTFGCLVHLEDTVTAITFVALGTSLPDTFASRVAAIQDKDADNAIGNVTGSNSVNVFLGLGLPWFIASVYWSWRNQKFIVSSAGLNFSVCLYTVCSFLTIALLLCRRNMKIFGRAELGGPTFTKYLSALMLVLLWFIYIIFSVLDVYGYLRT